MSSYTKEAVIAPRIFSCCLELRTSSKEEEELLVEEEEEEGCFNNNNNLIQNTGNEHSFWSDLPIDILCEIADRLPYWDLVRFAAVCRTWRVIIYGVHLPQRSTLLVPYLMSYTCIRDRKHIEFVDLQGETYKYTVGRILFDDTRLYASKYGWLLLKKYERPTEQFYLYNPFWNDVIRLPRLDLELDFQVVLATFTTPPIYADCVIFVISRRYGYTDDHIINACKLRDRRWSVHKTRYQGSVEGVTYLDGIFYCVIPQIIDGSLSLSINTFNIALQDWVMDYASITLEHHTQSTAFCVVESDGKLLLAVSDELVLHGTRNWFIYQFDWLRKYWTRVQSLGNQVLLLSRSSSIACPTLGRDSKFSNMIFHLNLGKEPFTFSGDGVWRRP
ncbi:putative F-box domain-containing protein [Rosa chinensis]|uniref:Putative F-box domain-containing protein n=1 Tax=Rosa chinensis TaxID=74649 RepID=A0A2P6PX55_ROSCH|nr:putative F-box domain-containing protein [Rosa chinensis]